MHLRRWWKWALAVAGTALAIYVIVEIVLAGRGELPNPPSSSPVILHGGVVLANNHLQSRSWSFSYTRAELSPDDITGTIDGVRNGTVYRKGKPYLSISAHRISINTQSLDFTATGKVHIEMLNDPLDRAFDTDLVTWTNYAKLLRMDHPSYLHVGGQTLRIDSIVVDFDKNEVHLGHINGSVGI